MGPVIHWESNETRALAANESGVPWWGGWDLNPRSPVPETGISSNWYCLPVLLDQAVPTEGWSGPPPLSKAETQLTNKPIQMTVTARQTNSWVSLAP